MSGHNPALRPAQVFARRVKEARERRGWSQTELAERVSTYRTTVARIEKGQTDPRLDVVLQFAAALGVAPVHLIVPLEDEGELAVSGKLLSAPKAREWIRGRLALDDADPDAYIPFLLEMPEEEARRMIEDAYARKVPALERALMQDDLRELSRKVLNTLAAARSAGASLTSALPPRRAKEEER